MGDSLRAFLESPLGVIRIGTDGEAITEVHLTGNPEIGDSISSVTYPAILQEAMSQLKAYFDRRLICFDLPLRPSGTEFQKRVWETLLDIPYGQTISYSEMARRLGDPKTIRAAASANGKNPIAIVIPCHRVIGANGSLVGYAGGLRAKKWLLELEKLQVTGSRQTVLFD